MDGVFAAGNTVALHGNRTLWLHVGSSDLPDLVRRIRSDQNDIQQPYICQDDDL